MRPPYARTYGRERPFTQTTRQRSRKWESLGAGIIHLVDLNGAIEGNAMNFDVIKRIKESVSIPGADRRRDTG